jgi:hypothetical protein
MVLPCPIVCLLLGAHLAKKQEHWLLTPAILLVCHVAAAQLQLAVLPPSALKKNCWQA